MLSDVNTIEAEREGPLVYETQNLARANMRGKLLFSFRCKVPAFLCRCYTFGRMGRKFRFRKSAPTPTAAKAVKGVDQFQLAVTAFMNRILRTQSRSCYFRHGHFGGQLVEGFLRGFLNLGHVRCFHRCLPPNCAI